MTPTLEDILMLICISPYMAFWLIAGFLVNQNSNMQLLHSFSSGSFLANERKTRLESITLPSKRGVPSTYIGYVNIW